MLYRNPLISCIVLLTHCISQAAGATTAGLTNLGLGLDGAATASSRYSDAYAAAYAIDGALSTECRTRSEISPWFQVILEEDKLISVIRIFADYDMGLERATLDFYQEREFELVKRLAGSNFRRIYGEAIDDLPVEFAYEAVLDTPVTAKTLRLTYFGSYAEIRMTEFQIWGQSAITPPPTGAPVGLPSAAPTKSPVPSASPSDRPSFSPTIREEIVIIPPENDCDNLDDAYFFVNGAVQRDCDWLKGQTSSTIDDMCMSPSYPVSQVCFSTCSTCLSRRAQTTWDSTTPIEGCEDLEDVQFPVIGDTSGRTQNCAWLRGQPEEVMEAYCVSTSPAFHICEDTCGKCIDVCQDDHAVLLDPYNTSPQRPGRASTCSQLANLPREIGAACQVPQIRNACQDTCDSCSVVPTAAPSPAPSMDDSTPAPTTKAPTGSPSSSPSMDSVSVEEIVTGTPALTAPTCDDDDDARFWVGLDVNQVQHCIWLAARPTYQAILCVDGHESGAYHSCAETCGKCSDTCEDIPGAVFDVDGATRNCVWLSIRPHKQDEVCFPGHPAWELCLESCDVCDFA